MNLHLRNLSVCAVVVFAVMVMAAQSYAILFTQTQILINPDQRVATITVKNTTDKVKTYRFTWTEMAMFEEHGGIRKLKDGQKVEGLKAASDYIRFSPQRIRMQPGQVQQVRFLVRRTRDMTDGEYRSYFSLAAEPDVNSYDSSDSQSGGYVDTGVTFDVGWRVPLILRHGQVTASAKFTGAELKAGAQGRKALHYKLERSGNMSVLGTVRVVCASNGDKVLTSAGVKAYTEVTHVQSAIAIKADQLPCKDLVLKLYSDADDPVFGTNALIAEIPVKQ